MAQTRWVFCLCALASLTTTLPGAFVTATAATLPAVTVAYVALALAWVVRYVSGRALVVLDVTEALAVAVLAATGSDPAAVFGFVFSALWFRALYGSTTRAVLLCAYLAAGLVASLPLWGLVRPDEGAVPVAVVLSSIANMFLTTGIARYLAVSLFAREEAQRRDAALVRLGQRLIGLTDRREIQACAQECSDRIYEATHGLVALLVRGTPEGLTVVKQAGALPPRPSRRFPTGPRPCGTLRRTVQRDHPYGRCVTRSGGNPAA